MVRAKVLMCLHKRSYSRSSHAKTSIQPPNLEFFPYQVATSTSGAMRIPRVTNSPTNGYRTSGCASEGVLQRRASFHAVALSVDDLGFLETHVASASRRCSNISSPNKHVTWKWTMPCMVFWLQTRSQVDHGRYIYFIRGLGSQPTHSLTHNRLAHHGYNSWCLVDTCDSVTNSAASFGNFFGKTRILRRCCRNLKVGRLGKET